MLLKCIKCHKIQDIIVKGEEFIPSNKEYNIFVDNKVEIGRYNTQIATKVMLNNKECLKYKCIDCDANNIIEKGSL